MKLNLKRIVRASLFVCSLAVSYAVLQRISYLSILILAGCFLLVEFYGSSRERIRLWKMVEDSIYRAAELLYEEVAVLGGSTIRAMEGISRTLSEYPMVASAMGEIGARLRLGQPFHEALDSTSVEGPLKRSISSAFGCSESAIEINPDAIKSILNERERQTADLYEELGHSTQKYVTLGMVSSTVVPSLALFSLTGYSITGYSSTVPLIFILLFAGVLPMFYRLNNIKMGAVDG
jgi:hypothetical protein